MAVRPTPRHHERRALRRSLPRASGIGTQTARAEQRARPRGDPPERICASHAPTKGATAAAPRLVRPNDPKTKMYGISPGASMIRSFPIRRTTEAPRPVASVARRHRTRTGRPVRRATPSGVITTLRRVTTDTTTAKRTIAASTSAVVVTDGAMSLGNQRTVRWRERGHDRPPDEEQKESEQATDQAGEKTLDRCSEDEPVEGSLPRAGWRPGEPPEPRPRASWR